MMRFGAMLMAGFMALQAMGGFGGMMPQKEVDTTEVTLVGTVEEVAEERLTLRVMPTRQEGEKPERPEGKGRGGRGGKRDGRKNEKVTEEAAAETAAEETTAETTEETGKPEKPQRGQGRGMGGMFSGKGHRGGRGGAQTVTLTASAELLAGVEKGDYVTVTTDAEGAAVTITETEKPEMPERKEETVEEVTETATEETTAE